MTTISGRGQVRFSELFADTVSTHGAFWALAYYVKHGMTVDEFSFWLRATGN